MEVHGNAPQERGLLKKDAAGAEEAAAGGDTNQEPEPETPGLLARLTDFSASRRGRWLVLLVWLIVAGLFMALAPGWQACTTTLARQL